MFFGDGGAPDGDGDDLFEPVRSFGAGEGAVFGRHTVDEVEGAADLLRREDGAVGFV